MRNFFLICLTFVSFFVFTFSVQSCKKKVNEDGLTREITDLVPQEILDEMIVLGMPINGGNKPPQLEGTFLASPFILKNSNVLSDYEGMSFADYYATFYDQNNKDLSIKYSYINGPESGEGLGGYIVGDKNTFSIFAELTATAYGEEVSMVHVISGTIEDDGIKDLFFANFMLDNNDNPNGYWIANGQGRIIYDSDGFSPKTGVSKSATDKQSISFVK